MSLNSPRLIFALTVIAATSSFAASAALGQTKRTFDNSSTPTPGAEQYFDGPGWSAGKWAGRAFPIGDFLEGTQGEPDDLGYFGNPAVAVDNPITLSTSVYQALSVGGWSFNSNGAGATTYSIQAQGTGGPIDVTLGGLNISVSNGEVSGTGSRILVVSDISERDVNIGVSSPQALNLVLGISGTQGEIYVSNGRTMTIGSVISGTNKGIVKTGAGTLSLTGASTFTGTTTLSSGTIRLGVASSGSVGSITSSAIGRGSLELNGGTLSSGSSASRTILNAYTIGGDVTLGNATNNGALTFSAAGTLTGSRTLTVDSSVTLSGTLGESSAGVGALTKAGAGTLTLSGNNTNGYTGLTTINAGTLIVSGGNAIADAGAVTMTGGTLQLNSNETISSLSGSGGTVNLGSNTLTVGDTNDTTFAGSINGTGGLTKQGDGDLTLTGSNNFTGLVTVNGGGRLVGNAGNLGGTKTVGDNAILEFNQASNGSFNGDINGTGAVWKTGSGALTLGGSQLADGFTGNIGVNAGKLELASAISMSAGFISVADTATIDVDGTLTTSGLQIQSGGTLQGAGTIVGNVDVLGSVSPGNSPDTLTINGDIQFSAAAILNFELVQNDQTIGGGINDLIVVNGDLVLDGTLNVTDASNPLNTTWTTSGTFANPTTWTLFTFTGSLIDNGLVLGNLPTLTGTPSPQEWRLNIVYSGVPGSGGSVNLQAVPEPSAALVLGGLLAGAACLRRRRVA